jgi:hypothetical protein
MRIGTYEYLGKAVIRNSVAVSFDWNTFGSYQRAGQVLPNGRSGFIRHEGVAYRAKIQTK